MKDIFKSLKHSLKNLNSTGHQNGASSTHHHEKLAKTGQIAAAPAVTRSATGISPRTVSEATQPGLSRHSTRQDVIHSSLPSSSRQTPKQPALTPTPSARAAPKTAEQKARPVIRSSTPRSSTPACQATDLYSSSAVASTPRHSSEAAHLRVGDSSEDDSGAAPPVHLILSDHQSPSPVPLLTSSPDEAIRFTLVNEQGVPAAGGAKTTAQTSPRVVDPTDDASPAAMCERDRQRSRTPLFVMSASDSRSRPTTPVFQEQPASPAVVASGAEQTTVPCIISHPDTTTLAQATPPPSQRQKSSDEDDTAAPRQTSSTRAAAVSDSSQSDEGSAKEHRPDAKVEFRDEEDRASHAATSTPVTQGGSASRRPSRQSSRLEEGGVARASGVTQPGPSSVLKPTSVVSGTEKTRKDTPLPSPTVSRASSTHRSTPASAVTTSFAPKRKTAREVAKPRSAFMAARQAPKAVLPCKGAAKAVPSTQRAHDSDEDKAERDEKGWQRRTKGTAAGEAHASSSRASKSHRTPSCDGDDRAAATTSAARRARLPRRPMRSVSPLLQARHVTATSPLAHHAHYRHDDQSPTTPSLSSSLSSAYRQVSCLPERHSHHHHQEQQQPQRRQLGGRRAGSAHSLSDGSSGRRGRAARSHASASLTRVWRDGERRRGRPWPSTPFRAVVCTSDDSAEGEYYRDYYTHALLNDDEDDDYRRGHSRRRHSARRHAASASRERRTPPRVAYSSSLVSRRSYSSMGSMTPHSSTPRRRVSVRPLDSLLSSDGYANGPHGGGSAHSSTTHRLSSTPRRASRRQPRKAATPQSARPESRHTQSRTSSRHSVKVAEGEPVRDDDEVQNLLQEIEAELVALAASIDYHESLRDQDMVANPWTRLYHLNNRQERQAREARLRRYKKLHRVRHMLLSGELDRRLARRAAAVRELDAQLRDPNSVFQRLYASSSYPGSRRARSADDSRGDASTATTTTTRRGGQPLSSTNRSHATSAGRSAKEACLNLYASGRAKWTRLQERQKAALLEQERAELNELLVGRLAGELERKAAATPRRRTPVAPDAWLQQARTLLPQRMEQDGDAVTRELLRGPRLTAAEQASVTRRLTMHSNARALERLAAEREKRLKEECTFRPTINETTGQSSARTRGGRGYGDGHIHSALGRRSHGHRVTSNEGSDRLSDSVSSARSGEEGTPTSKVDRCSLLYKKAAQRRRQQDEWRAARVRETRLQILRERMKNDHHFRRRVELDPSLADRFMRSLVV